MKKIVLFIIICSFFLQGYGQRKGSITNIGNNISVAMVDSYFDYCHHIQLHENWCWAACIQMVLDYFDISVSQTDIVCRAYGGSYDVTADCTDIIKAVNGWHKNESTIYAKYETKKDARFLIDKTISHSPLIIGLDEKNNTVGHAYVLTHIFFEKDYWGTMTPRRVVVVNPAKSNDMEESMGWTEFYNRINTIITINVY